MTNGWEPSMLNQVQHDKWMRTQYAESSSAWQMDEKPVCWIKFSMTNGWEPSMLNQVQHDRKRMHIRDAESSSAGQMDESPAERLCLKPINGFYSHGKGDLIMGKLIHPRIIFVIFVEWFFKMAFEGGLYLKWNFPVSHNGDVPVI